MNRLTLGIAAALTIGVALSRTADADWLDIQLSLGDRDTRIELHGTWDDGASRLGLLIAQRRNRVARLAPRCVEPDVWERDAPWRPQRLCPALPRPRDPWWPHAGVRSFPLYDDVWVPDGVDPDSTYGRAFDNLRRTDARSRGRYRGSDEWTPYRLPR